MKHLLALDQGTTSSRAIVFDERGRIVALAQKEFAQHFPRSGWVEHDPRDLWQTQIEVAREVLATAKIDARDIAALGITNQRETAVVWDRATGEPVYNAIVWQDRRTAPACDRLKAEGYGQTFRAKSGLIIDSYFSGTKVGWILDNVAGARERAERGELAFGTVDSWIVWQLTRGRLHVTDVSNASRTMLFNIHQNDWDEELARILRVPLSMLPDVAPSASVFGHTDADMLGAPVVIGGIGGDQQAALFGQTCFEPGMAKNTYGTGCFMLLQTGSVAKPSKAMLLTTSACQIAAEPPIGGRRYALEGSIFVAGAVVQWLRDGLGIIKTSAEVQQLAASVPDTGGVVFVPAFTGLGAPHWDSYARGAILGMSRGTTAAHIARAAIESIAYQSTELLQAMREDSGEALTELRVDGGAAINDMLMQFQADLLGVPVVRPKVLETTALGAAYLAGIAVGVWPDLKTLSAQWEVDRRFEPTMSRVEAQNRLARWRDAVQRAKGWDKPAERG